MAERGVKRDEALAQGLCVRTPSALSDRRPVLCRRRVPRVTAVEWRPRDCRAGITIVMYQMVTADLRSGLGMWLQLASRLQTHGQAAGVNMLCRQCLPAEPKQLQSSRIAVPPHLCQGLCMFEVIQQRSRD